MKISHWHNYPQTYTSLLFFIICKRQRNNSTRSSENNFFFSHVWKNIWWLEEFFLTVGRILWNNKKNLRYFFSQNMHCETTLEKENKRNSGRTFWRDFVSDTKTSNYSVIAFQDYKVTSVDGKTILKELFSVNSKIQRMRSEHLWYNRTRRQVKLSGRFWSILEMAHNHPIKALCQSLSFDINDHTLLITMLMQVDSKLFGTFLLITPNEKLWFELGLGLLGLLG